MDRISKMEQEMIGHLSKISEKMIDLSSDNLMSEEALRQLSKDQMDQYQTIQQVFTMFNLLLQTTYVKQRVTKTEVSQRKKKMTEKEKRAQAILFPNKYHICDRCNRIFTSKWGMTDHQEKTVICRVIKNTKQGLLEENNMSTRAWGKNDAKATNINKYIADNVEGDDTEEEEEAEAAAAQEDE